MGKNYLIFSEQVGKQNPEWVAEEKGNISVQAIFPEHGKCLGIRKPGGMKEEEMSLILKTSRKSEVQTHGHLKPFQQERVRILLAREVF